MENKVNANKSKLVVYAPDTRGVTVSPFGLGNLKLGPDVFTYSRLPGKDIGTCPGSTPECEAICYAKRVVTEAGIVAHIWKRNSALEEAEPLPPSARLLCITSREISQPSDISIAGI